jgi:tripartite ATP-independent transporter DctM subunit
MAHLQLDRGKKVDVRTNKFNSAHSQNASFIENFLRRIVEILASALVLAEIIILFVGVISRYVFSRPLIATDELSQIMFLWLSMLGSVLALYRGQHMRMTAVVNKLSERGRARMELLAMQVTNAFLCLLVVPSLHYAHSEQAVLTPALEISDALRVSAIPVGVCLMMAFGVLRLISLNAPRQATIFTVTGAFLALAAWQARFFLADLGNINLIVFFVGVVGTCVLAGIPIAFCFGLATFAYLALCTSVPLDVVVGAMDQGMSHSILLSVPLFVFLGLLLEMTGMARAMVGFLANILGHVRGGLSYVLVGAMYLVSGISGAKAADMAAIAPVLFPEMRERGAKPGELVALLAATGAQTETIPPSLVLITVGSVTGVSIASLFTGGMLPGVVLGSALCILVWLRSRGDDLRHVQRQSRRAILKAFVVAIPALALPFVIRAAVIEGVATATEVSTIGVFYSIAAGLLVYRRFDWKRLPGMLIETAALSGSILLIIGAATGMGWALTQSGFSDQLATAMASLPGGKGAFIVVSIFAFIALGAVLEGIPAIVLFGPLLFPIARQLGVNEVHYAMVVILSMGVGLFSPPFGVGYYAACAIGRVNPDLAMKPIVGYMLTLLVGLGIVAAFPWLSVGFL